MTETAQPALDLLDWTAVAAVAISLVALWRTGRERTLSLLSDAHQQAVVIELAVNKEVLDQIGAPVGYWAERVEEKYTEARRIYARTRRHLKRADFVWGASRALDRASHPGIKIENLPPGDSN